MPIVNRVPELVAKKFGGKKNVNISEVQKDTRLTYATVARWVKGEVDRFDAPALVAWCKYLGVGVGDILVYEPDKD